MNRGSAAGAGSERWLGAGFNEAPIHESGKWVKACAANNGIVRFNEAPIHESGKWPSCVDSRVRLGALQ